MTSAAGTGVHAKSLNKPDGIAVRIIYIELARPPGLTFGINRSMADNHYGGEARSGEAGTRRLGEAVPWRIDPGGPSRRADLAQANFDSTRAT